MNFNMILHFTSLHKFHFLQIIQLYTPNDSQILQLFNYTCTFDDGDDDDNFINVSYTCTSSKLRGVLYVYLYVYG